MRCRSDRGNGAAAGNLGDASACASKTIAMKSFAEFGAFCVGKKGYDFLASLCARDHRPSLVCAYPQPNDRSRSFERIRSLASEAGALFVESRTPRIEQTGLSIFVVGWQYIIPDADLNLIVFHDSLLPRYRGFAPTVTALMNGDPELGVTAFIPVAEADAGPIVAQARRAIRHPIRVAEALEMQSALMADIATSILQGTIDLDNPIHQDASKATYSLWRDELDFFIDWHADAAAIQRQVYACGFPYGGARAIYDGSVIIIDDVEIAADVCFERRDVGKIGRLDAGEPIVVCGSGCIKIKKASMEGGAEVAFKKLRSRFFTKSCSWPPQLEHL